MVGRPHGSGGTANGLAAASVDEDAIHRVGRLLAQRGHHVRIDVHRRADVRVAKSLHDHAGRDALSQQQRST